MKALIFLGPSTFCIHKYTGRLWQEHTKRPRHAFVLILSYHQTNCRKKGQVFRLRSLPKMLPPSRSFTLQVSSVHLTYSNQHFALSNHAMQSCLSNTKTCPAGVKGPHAVTPFGDLQRPKTPFFESGTTHYSLFSRSRLSTNTLA